VTDEVDALSELELRLRDAVNTGWHRLVRRVASADDERRAYAAGEKLDTLAPLVALTGMQFRELDMVRHVRHDIDHPDERVPLERLQAAVRIIEEAETRLGQSEPSRAIEEAEQRRQSSTPTPDRSDRQATGTAIGKAVDSTPAGLPPYSRVTLRKPVRRHVVPRKHGSESAPRDGAQHQTTSRHLEFRSVAGERSDPQLIPLNELGLSPRLATVTPNVPWLSGVIVGDSVRLIAAPTVPDSKHRGSVRIDSHEGSVTITVDAYTLPVQRKPAATEPASYREAIIVAVLAGLVIAAFIIAALS